jgi:hypothetical protein
MAIKSINSKSALMNQVISILTPNGTALTTVYSIEHLANVDVYYLVQVATGLTATFNIMVSVDGVNFYDSGQILPSVSGTAKNFVAEYTGGFPFVALQVTWGSGSGNVQVNGGFKGVA